MSSPANEIRITLPDGSVRTTTRGSTGADVAASIGAGLAKAALAVKVDGEMKDLDWPIQKDAKVEIVTRKSEEALDLIRRFAPRYLVVSAGMDIYADDPLGTIKVTTLGIGQIGERIAALDLPSVIVMEGGYNNEALGKNIVTFLGEFQ